MGREPDPLEPRRLNEQQFFDGLRGRLDWPDLGPDTELAGNEKWDSLAQVDVVMYVQDELGHTLVAEELQKVATGRELAGLVKDRFA